MHFKQIVCARVNYKQLAERRGQRQALVNVVMTNSSIKWKEFFCVADQLSSSRIGSLRNGFYFVCMSFEVPWWRKFRSFYVMMACSLVRGYQHFRGTYYPHLQRPI